MLIFHPYSCTIVWKMFSLAYFLPGAPNVLFFKEPGL